MTKQQEQTFTESVFRDRHGNTNSFCHVADQQEKVADQESGMEQKIREICTFHSDDGTSGYNLSEEQFERLFELFDWAIRETCERLRVWKLTPLAMENQEKIKMFNAIADGVNKNIDSILEELK